MRFDAIPWLRLGIDEGVVTVDAMGKPAPMVGSYFILLIPMFPLILLFLEVIDSGNL